MKFSSRLLVAALAAVMSFSFVSPMAARADGAASTRNIIFGAAAIGGTLLIINHNKKVHQKYAEYDRRQAETAHERNQAQAAYASQRQAYLNEAALVSDLKHEVAYQHSAVAQRDKQIASLKHSLIVAKYGRDNRTAFVQRTSRPTSVRNAPPRRADVANGTAPQAVSYGWGSY